MTFRNLQTNRIFRAVMIVVGVGIVVSFCACYCFLVIKLMPNVDPNADMASQQDQLQRDAEKLFEDVYRNPSSDINLLFVAILGFVTLLTFWQAHWAALTTRTPEEAMGHAVAVGLGILLGYGALLFLFGPTLMVIKLLFYVGLIAVSAVAGRIAGQKISPDVPAFAPAGGPVPGAFGPSVPLQPGGQIGGGPRSGSPEVFYNMGVSAAIGGRRDEARQHFTQVIQLSPRHIPAWLQLANLADTPEQAWDYVQQARAINPNDPAVVQAAGVIWPKVAANAQALAASPPPDLESPVQPPPHIAPPPATPGAGTPPESGTKSDVPPESSDHSE
jgi:tetratricopeptide (TPR) repeat protein